MKFVAYYRASTSQQKKSSQNLDSQRACVNTYIAGTNGDLICEYTEVVSGLQDSCVVLTEALKRCRSEQATLVIAKLDLLARRLDLFSELLESDVPLLVADLPNASKFVLQMLAVLAEREHALIAERTKLALAKAKAHGVRLGNPQIAQARQQAIKARKIRANSFAHSMYAQISLMRAQQLSYRQIADNLNKLQFRTANGGRWWPTTVANIYKRGEAGSTLDDLPE